jgi:hypothetical protein
MTAAARERLNEAAPDLLMAWKRLRSSTTEQEQSAALQAGDAAMRKAEVGPLAARLLHRRASIAGIQAARDSGKRLGRPPFVMTPARRMLLAIWRQGEPRDPIRVLAQVLGCSVGKAIQIAREGA